MPIPTPEVQPSRGATGAKGDAGLPGSVGGANVDPTLNVKDLVRESVSRLDALREAEVRRIDDILALRAFYTEKLEIAESKRIDAIRAVDVNAVAIANQRATDQAAVLAAQVQASAETLRVQLQNTAAIFKQQLDQAMAQLSDRISSVERFQYEGKGSAGSISPALQEQLERLATQVAMLKESKDRGEGRSGISAPLLATIVAAVVGLVVFLIQRAMVGSK